MSSWRRAFDVERVKQQRMSLNAQQQQAVVDEYLRHLEQEVIGTVYRVRLGNVESILAFTDCATWTVSGRVNVKNENSSIVGTLLKMRNVSDVIEVLVAIHVELDTDTRYWLVPILRGRTLSHLELTINPSPFTDSSPIVEPTRIQPTGVD